MRLAMFEIDGQRHIGVADDEGRLVEVTDIVGSDMNRLIRQAEHMLPQLAGVARGVQFPVYREEDVSWLAPVPAPGKICGVPMNNLASEEHESSAPGDPAFFLKPSSCLVGHREPVRVRTYYGSVHPGPGLAVIIGKQARDVDAADAHEHIFGYTMFNDIRGDTMRSTGSDTFGCMGPWLVTADEVDDPDNLAVYCAVGGESIADDSTRNYKVAEVVSFISQFQTLEPGDVVSCGTAPMPSANAKTINEADLQQVGGPVEMRIEGLGVLSNPVVVEDREIGNWRLQGD